MNVEIINTGSELMLGRTLNTHQQWLCRNLADLGYPVTRQVAIADAGITIQLVVKEALTRADLIIVTGGLGPTSDDITRDLISDLLGKPLRDDPAVAEHIRRLFAKRNRPMPARVFAETRVPEDAQVLMNQFGTAPGLVMQVNPNPYRASGKPAWLVMLPGPPRELRPMFTDQVVPFIRAELPLERPFVVHTLRTLGLGESYIEELIDAPLKPLTDAGLGLGYCARMGEVELRFVGEGERAAEMVAEAEQIVHGLLGPYIYANEDETLEASIVRKLTELKQTVAFAESCTGGYVSNRITNVPGASRVLLAGLVTYSNEAKQKFLGVAEETLKANGAVSEPTAREMAEGARRAIGSDYAISITGIAGPDGGSVEKPVGTVFIALASVKETICVRMTNRYDRETFKYVTSNQALDLLRRAINGLPPLTAN